DFRNLVTLYDEVNGLNDGGDALGEIAGGLFARYKNFGVGVYTNSYIGLRPQVDLTTNSGFSGQGSATIDQIDQNLRAQGPIPPPSTANGQAFAQQLQAAGISPQSSADVASLAEQAGVDLGNQDLRDALRIAAATAGTAAAGGGIGNNLSDTEVRGLT